MTSFNFKTNSVRKILLTENHSQGYFGPLWTTDTLLSQFNWNLEKFLLKWYGRMVSYTFTHGREEPTGLPGLVPSGTSRGMWGAGRQVVARVGPGRGQTLNGSWSRKAHRTTEATIVAEKNLIKAPTEPKGKGKEATSHYASKLKTNLKHTERKRGDRTRNRQVRQRLRQKRRVRDDGDHK